MILYLNKNNCWRFTIVLQKIVGKKISSFLKMSLMFLYEENDELQYDNEALRNFIETNTNGESFSIITFVGTAKSKKSEIATQFSGINNNITIGASIGYIGRHNDIARRHGIFVNPINEHLFIIDTQGFTCDSLKTENLLIFLTPILSLSSVIVFFQQSFTNLSLLPIIGYIYGIAQNMRLIVNITGHNIDDQSPIQEIINQCNTSQISNELRDEGIDFDIVQYDTRTATYLYQKILENATRFFRNDINAFNNQLNNPLIIVPDEIFKVSSPDEYGVYKGLLDTMTNELYNLIYRHRILENIDNIDLVINDYNRSFEDYCNQFRPTQRVKDLINQKIQTILQRYRNRANMLHEKAQNQILLAQNRQAEKIANENAMNEISRRIAEMANEARVEMLNDINTESTLLINVCVHTLRIDLNNYINQLVLKQEELEKIRRYTNDIIDKFVTVKNVYIRLLEEKSKKKWIERALIAALIAGTIYFTWWYFELGPVLPAIKSLPTYCQNIATNIPWNQIMTALKSPEIKQYSSAISSYAVPVIAGTIIWFTNTWNDIMNLIGLRVDFTQINILFEEFVPIDLND